MSVSLRNARRDRSHAKSTATPRSEPSVSAPARRDQRWTPEQEATTHLAVTTVTSSTPVRVSVMVVPRRKHPHKVNGESKRADDEELSGVHLGGVKEPLNRLENDED